MRKEYDFVDFHYNLYSFFFRGSSTSFTLSHGAGLAMAAYFQGLLKPKGLSGNVWLRGAKDHVLATAQLSEYLARQMFVKESPGTAFTGGILHDIGKLVLSRMSPDIARQVTNRMNKEGLSLLEAEEVVLGTDHAEVGHRLGECWKVPEVMAEVIRYHHTPMQSQYLLTLIVYSGCGSEAQCHGGHTG